MLTRIAQAKAYRSLTFHSEKNNRDSWCILFHKNIAMSESEFTETEEFDPTDYYCEQIPASINPLFCAKGIDFDRLFRVLHHNDKEDIDSLLKTRDKPLVVVPDFHYRLMDTVRNDNDRYVVKHYYNGFDWYDDIDYDDDYPESFTKKKDRVTATAWKNLQECRKCKEVWYIKMQEATSKKLKAYYRKRAETEKHNCRHRDKIYNMFNKD